MFSRAKKILFGAAAVLLLACGMARAEATRLSPDVLDAIYNNPAAVSFGDGSLTIVEFFDYQCSYCKADEEVVARLLQDDTNIRLIYVDFPKLGPLSTMGATAAVSVLQQGPDKYWQFRHILMDKNVHISEPLILQAAQYAAVDADRMQTDMANPAAAQLVENNIQLGRQAGVSVTPSFIVGPYFYPGFHTYEQFQDMINYARAAN